MLPVVDVLEGEEPDEDIVVLVCEAAVVAVVGFTSG